MRSWLPGGTLLAGFMNPDPFIFDVAALDRSELVVRNRLLFGSLDLTDAEQAQYYADARSNTATR